MTQEQIARNLTQVRERIAQAAERAGRAAEDITLVAVSKTRPAEDIAAAYAAGIRDFGESYVQEALAKASQPALALSDLRWHFIGHLQSNKVRDVVGRFALLHSVDSRSLAQALGQRAARFSQVADILLEVKLDPAATKFGFSPAATRDSVEQIAQIPGLRLRGLMGMAPYAPDPEAARPFFRTLHGLFTQLPSEMQHTLSMGMSGDFEVAIEEGASLVRIGTAVFGPRQP
jgi:PLP dependent protein